ncbi:MAG: prepilin-type N-terminal cleavage/methylation domain-containing protein [Thermodesulfobacteriota bacterium]
MTTPEKLFRGRQGFTLIEVLIATVVIGVGFMAVASMQGTSIHGNSQSNYLTEATYLAEDKMEEFYYLAFVNITNAGSPEVNIDPRGAAGGIFTRSWNVVDNTPDVFMKTITVTVTWTERGAAHRLDMTTIIGS